MPPEKILERWFVDRAKQLGWIAYKLRSPGQRGMPDRLVIGPNGHFFFVEFKSPSGRLRPEQRREIQRLRDLGHRVHVLSDQSSASDILTYANTEARHSPPRQRSATRFMGTYGPGEDGNDLNSDNETEETS